MPLAKFAAAKIAALPLMLLYVLIGASTDTFMGGDGMEDGEGASAKAVGGKEIAKVGVDEDTHRKMVLFGLCLSIVSMTAVSHFVKKELYKVGTEYYSLLSFHSIFGSRCWGKNSFYSDFFIIFLAIDFRQAKER